MPQCPHKYLDADISRLGIDHIAGTPAPTLPPDQPVH